MVYDDLLEEESINAQYLITLSPRRIIDDLSFVASNVFESTFDYGNVISVTVDGVSFTQTSNSSPSANEWYYDLDSQLFRINDGTNFIITKTVVATYVLYVGTFDANWHLDPLDDTTAQVYWEPLIVRSPVIKQSNNDANFGFIPIQSSQLELSNATKFFDRHVYDSSFNDANLNIYHYLGDLTVANTKLIFAGLCSNVTYTYDKVTISVFDSNFVFDPDFRHHTGSSFYNTTDFANLDPNFIGKPIRGIFGVVDGVLPINVEYFDEFGSIVQNRNRVVMNEADGVSNLTTTVSASPASTNTRTYIASANGINVGDSLVIGPDAYDAGVQITDISGTFTLVSGTTFSAPFLLGDISLLRVNAVVFTEATSSTSLATGEWFFSESTQTVFVNDGTVNLNSQTVDLSYFSNNYVIVTAVNRTGSQYVDHNQVTRTANSSETVTRSYVGNVSLTVDGIVYPLFLGRDYRNYSDAGSNTVGFSFISDMGGSKKLSLPRTWTSADLVFCRVYGPRNTTTLGGSGFGGNSTETDNLTNPIVIITELLKRNLGLAESQINTATLTSLESAITSQIGFSIPQTQGAAFGSFKDILSKIGASELLSFYINDDNLVDINQITVAVTGKTIEDDELLLDSYSNTYSYKDIISDVFVEYKPSEVDRLNQASSQLNYQAVQKTSNNAKWLHLQTKQRTFSSLHIYQSDAEDLATRLIAIYGDRQGRAKISVKNRFFDTQMGDSITLNLEKLPGFEYVSGTLRSRSHKVIGWDKSLNNISITLDDQKGIEDNSGDF